MKILRRQKCYALLSIFSSIFIVSAIDNNESCAYLYEKGAEAYLENRFEDCVEHFEKALERYRVYSKHLQNCRIQCRKKSVEAEPLYPVDVENLLFFEKTVRATLCLVKCKNERLEEFGNYNINPETEKLFEERRAYEYLHLCYFQTKDFQKAASAVFTFLVAHPDNKAMLASLKHYSQLEGVDVKKIVNFEASDYVYLYTYGSDAYDKKNWDLVIQYMENSLEHYLQTEEECRAQCEGPFDPGWYPDFVPAISNHFTYCLKCKQSCKRKLSSLNGETYDDLVASHYHYLQYAYYKTKDFQAACQAVASYLLFYPDDQTMIENMEFYKKLPKVQDEFFKPRDEAVQYVQRDTYERKILEFIKKEFSFDSSIGKQFKEDYKFKLPTKLIQSDIASSKRFILDNLASPRECQALLKLAKTYAMLGDGYYGIDSPLTSKEKFEGITLGRTTFLSYVGLLNHKYLQIYVNLTEAAKDAVEQYFELRDTLYFAYTHLVCRSALPGSYVNRTDFSHPVHADNCQILMDGSCHKTPSSYTWRDYSAIIYLNNDFEGGEFIFSSDPSAKEIEDTVQPKCGRMVAFSSGKENLHGVKAVLKGTRCALAIWFTFDQNQQENDRNIAKYVSENDLLFDFVSTRDMSKL